MRLYARSPRAFRLIASRTDLENWPVWYSERIREASMARMSQAGILEESGGRCRGGRRAGRQAAGLHANPLGLPIGSQT